MGFKRGARIIVFLKYRKEVIIGKFIGKGSDWIEVMVNDTEKKIRTKHIRAASYYNPGITRNKA